MSVLTGRRRMAGGGHGGVRGSHLMVGMMVFGCMVWITAGLKCLQCLDTAKDGPCQHDYMGLVNTSLEIFPNNSKPYYKECPDGSLGGNVQNNCVIEQFYVGGELKSFIRDCSDGQNFSFTGTVTNPRLENLVPDNFTTCIYIISANAHICVSLCNNGDFCNAPKPPPPGENATDCEPTENGTCGASALRLWRPTSGPFGGTLLDVVAVYVGGDMVALLLPLLVVMLGVQVLVG